MSPFSLHTFEFLFQKNNEICENASVPTEQ